MAERRPVRDRESANGEEDRPRLTAAKAGRYGLRQIAELTGKDPEGVTGVEPAEDGWLVTVEVVEDRRIPSSSDILSTYETEIGPDGGLVAYRRVRRYPRGRTDDGTS
jgi:gas vesicle protein GvpO